MSELLDKQVKWYPWTKIRVYTWAAFTAGFYFGVAAGCLLVWWAS